MDCPRCNSDDTAKAGKQNGKQKYWCNACQRHFQDEYDRDRPNYSSGTRDRYWKEKDSE